MRLHLLQCDWLREFARACVRRDVRFLCGAALINKRQRNWNELRKRRTLVWLLQTPTDVKSFLMSVDHFSTILFPVAWPSAGCAFYKCCRARVSHFFAWSGLLHNYKLGWRGVWDRCLYFVLLESLRARLLSMPFFVYRFVCVAVSVTHIVARMCCVRRLPLSAFLDERQCRLASMQKEIKGRRFLCSTGSNYDMVPTDKQMVTMWKHMNRTHFNGMVAFSVFIFCFLCRDASEIMCTHCDARLRGQTLIYFLYIIFVLNIIHLLFSVWCCFRCLFEAVSFFFLLFRGLFFVCFILQGL